ncbi:uncharacterized protein PAF06_002908 [Gastrophryne carolinensis]
MSNSSGNFTSCQPQHINIFIPIFLSFIFFAGFVLNCISLWIFWFKVKQWNSTVVLQFNLAISDAIITPAAPLIIIYSLTDHWTFGLFFCQFKVFLLSTHMYGSIYFLTIISIHRYLSVAHNVKRQSWIAKPFIVKLCLVVWGCLLLQGIPFFFVLKTSEVHGVTKCLSFHQTEQAVLFFVWNWVILFTGLLIPFSITLICYSLLTRYILKINPMNTLSKVMVSKSVKTIFISLIIFIICYIPVHITRTTGVTIILLSPHLCSLLESVEVAYYITWMMSGMNCCMDPIMYCFASDRFRKTFTSWCTFMHSGCEITNYTQGQKVEPPSDVPNHGPIPTMSTTETGMLNLSGNYTSCRPQTINPFIPIVLGITFFIGFVLNCISLWIFWFNVKQWNSTVVLQFNLAISDAIITPAAPLIIIYTLTNHWTFGLFFCQFKVFLLSTHKYGSIYFLTIISIHRYLSVAHNVKWQSWIAKPFIVKLCLIVWGCLLLQGIPFFFVLKTSEVHGVTKCLSIHQTEQAVLFFVWNWIILITGLLIPFSITLVCYSLLTRYILKINPMNTLSNVMVSRSVKTIFISLIIFIICYLPVHITRTTGVTILLLFPHMCSLLESIEVAYYITWMISSIDCCMDPILYCFASERFKKTFTSLCTFLHRQREKNIMDYDHGHMVEAASDFPNHGPPPIMNSTDTEL